jgi:hypothetical protein
MPSRKWTDLTSRAPQVLMLMCTLLSKITPFLSKAMRTKFMTTTQSLTMIVVTNTGTSVTRCTLERDSHQVILRDGNRRLMKDQSTTTITMIRDISLMFLHLTSKEPLTLLID